MATNHAGHEPPPLRPPMRLTGFALALIVLMMTVLAPIPCRAQTPDQDAIRIRNFLQSEIVRILSRPRCDDMRQAMRLIEATAVLSARYRALANTRAEIDRTRVQLRSDLLRRGCVSSSSQASIPGRTTVITVGGGGGTKNM